MRAAFDATFDRENELKEQLRGPRERLNDATTQEEEVEARARAMRHRGHGSVGIMLGATRSAGRFMSPRLGDGAKRVYCSLMAAD